MPKLTKKEAEAPENVSQEPQREEIAPEVIIENDFAEQDAALNELKLLAQTAGPRGPEARPGRFALRREGAVHTIDSNARIEDEEARERKIAAVNLYQSYVNKRILHGRIFGVRSAFDRDHPGKQRYYAVVKNGPYQVLIPFEKFADVDTEELLKVYRRSDPNKTLEDAAKIYMESRMDAEVDYIVSNLPEGADLDMSSFVGGNRVEAMRRHRIHFWYGVQANGQDQIRIGDTAQARVIAVARNGIRIEIFGVESFIPSRELSWTMIQDAALEHHVGDRVLVRITDIRRDMENDYSVEFNASVKQAQSDPRVSGLQFFADGGVYSGIINYIRTPTVDNPNVSPGVFVKLDEGVQCLCPFPNGSIPPRQGAHVIVRITSHDAERKFLFGLITHIRKGYT